MKACVWMLCLVMCACGTTGSVSLNKPTDNTETSFNLIDNRSDATKQSFEEISDNGKSIHFGDDILIPSAPEIIRNALEQKIGQQLAGKTVTLNEFSVNVYEPIVNIDRQGVYQAAATVPDGYAVAPLAELFIWAIENVRSEKNVLVQINGDVNGKIFAASQSETFKGRVTESNIKTLIDRAMNDVVLYMQNNAY